MNFLGEYDCGFVRPVFSEAYGRLPESQNFEVQVLLGRKVLNAFKQSYL